FRSVNASSFRRRSVRSQRSTTLLPNLKICGRLGISWTPPGCGRAEPTSPTTPDGRWSSPCACCLLDRARVPTTLWLGVLGLLRRCAGERGLQATQSASAGHPRSAVRVGGGAGEL